MRRCAAAAAREFSPPARASVDDVTGLLEAEPAASPAATTAATAQPEHTANVVLPEAAELTLVAPLGLEGLCLPINVLSLARGHRVQRGRVEAASSGEQPLMLELRSGQCAELG